MDESILTTIKKLLGINEEYEHFDQDIIIHINSTLMTLRQISVGPEDGLIITDKSVTWRNLLGDDANKLGATQSYVYLKVKLIFDPPQNSFTIDAMNKTANEMEWRLLNEADKPILVPTPAPVN